MKYIKRFLENTYDDNFVNEIFVLNEINDAVNYKFIDKIGDWNLKYMDDGLDGEVKLEIFVIMEKDIGATLVTSGCYLFYTDNFTTGAIKKEEECRKYKKFYDIFSMEGVTYRYSIYNTPFSQAKMVIDTMKDMENKIKSSGGEILLNRNTGNHFFELWFRL